jgi:hypothetical protein
MARVARTARCFARAAVGIAIACGIAACNSDGTTAACRTAVGEELPLYDIDEVDDAGVHPDPEVERIRAELADDTKNCLTPIGHASSPGPDSGTD